MARKLNKRQLAYCYYRARDNTIEQSMSKSGYTCKGGSARATGSQLEDNPNIQHRIEHERLNIFDKTMITEEYVLNNLKTLAEESKWPGDRIRANELLGKYLAMFTDKVKSEGTLTMTDKEKQELAIVRPRLPVSNN